MATPALQLSRKRKTAPHQTIRIISSRGVPYVALPLNDTAQMTFGAVKLRVCKLLGFAPNEYVITSTDGRMCKETMMMAKGHIVLAFFLMHVDRDLDPPVEMHGLEFEGTAAAEGLSEWAWSRPVEIDPSDTNARLIPAEEEVLCVYHKMPYEIFQKICKHVVSPIQLLDFRLVCRRYKDYIDANFTALLQPFRSEIRKMCVFNGISADLHRRSTHAPALLGGPWLDTTALVRTCQVTCGLLARPTDQKTKRAVIRSIRTMPNPGHPAFIAGKIMRAMAASRVGVAASQHDTPVDRDAEISFYARLLIAGRKCLGPHAVLINTVYESYAILANGEQFYEVWIDAVGAFHFIELNLIRMHACIHALRYQLWDARKECVACTAPRGNVAVVVGLVL